MLKNIQRKLSGKKTFLVALVAILTGLVGWIDNSISTPQFIDLVIEGVLAMTIRAGIAKG